MNGIDWIRSRTKQVESGCWEWMGSRDQRGYGSVFIGGKSRRAHRIAWVSSGRKLEASECVLHRCDNPPCCNPAHLFIGSQQDNVRDCIAKGRYSLHSGDSRRARPENMPRGERHCRASFTEEQIADIRRRVAAKRGIQTEIAREFGVNPATISKIVNRKLWSHVR